MTYGASKLLGVLDNAGGYYATFYRTWGAVYGAIRRILKCPANKDVQYGVEELYVLPIQKLIIEKHVGRRAERAAPGQLKKISHMRANYVMEVTSKEQQVS